MVPNQTQAEAQSHAIPPVAAAPFDNAPSPQIRTDQVADNFNELLTLGNLLRVAGSVFLGLIGIVGVIWAIKDANEPFR